MKIKKKKIYNFLNLLNDINSKKKNYNLSLNFFDNKAIFFFKNNDNKLILICREKTKLKESFYLNFKKLKCLLRSIKDNEYLQLIKLGKYLLIKNKNFKLYTKFKKRKNNSFYFLKLFDICNFLKIERKIILEALNNNVSTLKIADNKDTGLNIVIKNKKIFFYSTDGYRMSFYNIKYKNNLKIEINISKNIVLFLIKLIKNSKSNFFYINFKKKKFFFCEKKFFFISKECGNVNFNYKIIKKNKSFLKIKINHFFFYEAIKRVSSISTEKNNWVDIKFDKKKIFVKFDDLSERFKEEVFYKKNYITKNFRINIKYLTDFLKYKKSNFFYFYIKNRFKKIILRYKNNKNFKYLIMPIYY